MKKILVSLLIMLAVGSQTAFAEDEGGITKAIKENFEREFAGARSVKWNDLGDYKVATFTFNNNRVEAYFNTESGELEGAARFLIFDQLPLAVMKTFQSNFSEAVFINALEISNANGVCYTLTFETKSKMYKVKMASDGNVLSKVKVKP